MSRRSRASGRITLAQVAEAAGVSPITASRALRNDRNVAPALIERVREAAERLAYVPDPAAQALASARSRQVAVLVPLLSNRVFTDLLDAVQTTLLAEGYQTLIGVTRYDPREEERLLQGYLPHRPAGVLLTGFDRTRTSEALLARSGVPCLSVMELADGVPPHPAVGFSQRAAGLALTRHLVARGRCRIGFVGAQLDPRVLQRLEGCREGLREAGLAAPGFELLDPRPSSLALGAELLEVALAARPDLDALFFCNDDLAQGATLAAVRRGLAVPGQVAIAGFNDLEGSDQMIPPLTTVRTPRREIGLTAARRLLGLMQGRAAEPLQLDLGFELVVRGST